MNDIAYFKTFIADVRFAYRKSIYKKRDRRKAIIVHTVPLY